MSWGMGARLTVAEALEQDPEQLRALVCRAQVCVVECGRADVASFKAFAARLGSYVAHPLTTFRVPGHDDLLTISNLVGDGGPLGVHEGGAYWHTDMSYRLAHTIFTALHCIGAPPEGGETSFLDCRAGWVLVRQALREKALDLGVSEDALRALRVRHRFGNREALRRATAHVQNLSRRETESLEPAVVHELVQRHPLTGDEYLYAVAGTSFELEGHGLEDSRRLLDRLFDHMLAHAPRYEHRYRPGEIVIWDNLTTLHCGPEIAATRDPGRARVLYRTSIDYTRLPCGADGPALSPKTESDQQESTSCCKQALEN